MHTNIDARLVALAMVHFANLEENRKSSNNNNKIQVSLYSV